MSEGTTNTSSTPQTGSNNQGQRTGANVSKGASPSDIGAPAGKDAGGGRGTASKGTESTEPPKRYQFKGLKVGDKEIDFDGDENEVKRRIQQAYGANSAYSEAKKLREEAEQKNGEYLAWKRSQDEHKKSIAKDPMIAIRRAVQDAIDSGVDPESARAAGEQWVLENIKRDEESPEAKRARQAEEKLAKRDEEDAKRAKTDQEQRLAQAAQEERKKIVPEMLKQMDAVGLARTAANLSAVARRLKVASERGVPLTIERAVQMQHEENSTFVKTTVGGQAKAINDAFKSNDHDTVIKIGREVEGFLGEEVLVALQRYGIVKWKTKSPNMPHQAIDTAKSKTAEPEPELSYDEVIELRKKKAADLDRQRRGAVT